MAFCMMYTACKLSKQGDNIQYSAYKLNKQGDNIQTIYNVLLSQF